MSEGELAKSHPLLQAWESFKLTNGYKSASAELNKPWASAHLLWGVYREGWDAACMYHRIEATSPAELRRMLCSHACIMIIGMGIGAWLS